LPSWICTTIVSTGMRWPSASGVNSRLPQAPMNLPVSRVAATLAGSVEPAARIASRVTTAASCACTAKVEGEKPVFFL
jgi:hypothetical protein